jgi:CheY-like chemotaxis protein
MNGNPLVMIVDNDASVRRAVRRLLTGAIALEFIEATEGGEALRILRGRVVIGLPLPAVIVSDVDMYPGMCGPVLVSEIARTDSLQNIPIVLCSGDPDVHDVAAKLGVLSFQKASEPRILVGLVRKALGEEPVVV